MEDSDAEGFSGFSGSSDTEESSPSSSSPAQQAENFYWQGKAARDEGHPEQACNFFAQTLQLASTHSIPNAAQWKAKALKRTLKTCLKYKLQGKDLLKPQVEMLFALKPALSAAYFDKSVLNVFSTACASAEKGNNEFIAHSTNPHFLIELIRQKTASTLALYLRIETKYLLFLKDQGKWQQVSQLLPQLLAQMQQSNVNSVPVELHALELEMWHSLHRLDRVFLKYHQLTSPSFSAVATHPMWLGVVRSVGAKLHLRMGNYTGAMADFWEAVRCFDSAGASALRNCMVNGLVVAHVLAVGTVDVVDPFGSQEIAVHKNEAGVAFGVRLLQVWKEAGGELESEKSEGMLQRSNEFTDEFKDQLGTTDEFIGECRPLIEAALCERKLAAIFKATSEPEKSSTLTHSRTSSLPTSSLRSLSLHTLALRTHAPSLQWLRERICTLACTQPSLQLAFSGEGQVSLAPPLIPHPPFTYQRFNAALEHLVQAVSVRATAPTQLKRKGRW